MTLTDKAPKTLLITGGGTVAISIPALLLWIATSVAGLKSEVVKMRAELDLVAPKDIMQEIQSVKERITRLETILEKS